VASRRLPLQLALSSNAEQAAPLQEEESSLVSPGTKSTTFTEEAFGKLTWPEGNLPVANYVKQRLEQTATIGCSEHWLLRLSDVTLMPDQVLGKGGFGYVIAGRVRGSPVALKVTKCGPNAVMDAAWGNTRSHCSN